MPHASPTIDVSLKPAHAGSKLDDADEEGYRPAPDPNADLDERESIAQPLDILLDFPDVNRVFLGSSGALDLDMLYPCSEEIEGLGVGLVRQSVDDLVELVLDAFEPLVGGAVGTISHAVSFPPI